MKPLLVHVTDAQHRLLAALAKSLGVSKAQLIRDGVNLLLRQEASRGQDPLLDLVGQAGSVGPSLIASQVDASQADCSRESQESQRR